MHGTLVAQRTVRIPAGRSAIEGDLAIPPNVLGIVVFAHGSGSSRHSSRNRFVAESLQQRGLATLLFDLLTPEEEAVDLRTREFRFDISLLAQRLVNATDWLAEDPDVRDLNAGYFGASTGAAAALIAAAARQRVAGAVVSRGGRPDLAGDYLGEVRAPTLLIVGGNDEPVIALNERALAALSCPKELAVVPGATHLFEEPGALEEVTRLAGEWFMSHLIGGDSE